MPNLEIRASGAGIGEGPRWRDHLLVGLVATLIGGVTLAWIGLVIWGVLCFIGLL